MSEKQFKSSNEQIIQMLVIINSNFCKYDVMINITCCSLELKH